MSIYATNTAGEYGIPGMPVWRPRERREVTLDEAAYLQTRPEFRLEFDANDGRFRGEDGKPRWLGYFGPVDSRFGYGGGGISILRALTRLGVQARVTPYYNHGYETAYGTDLPADAAAHLQYRHFPQWTLAHCLPDDLPRLKSPRTVSWTMWEMDRIPDGTRKEVPFGDWARLINEHSQRLVVPCRHNAEVFANCGVQVPITVIPYGLDTDIWPYIERPERETFTVVQYGDLTDRKGPFEAVVAFQRAFPTEQNVRLILKSQHGHFGKATGGPPIIRDPRITLIDATWTRPQLVNFLGAADAFIWLSRGEGFGLPPLQAALTGLPVVMTTHSGMAEYYKPQYFYGVQSTGTSPAPLYGKWQEPDVDHAARHLRYIYEHRGQALKKGRRAASHIRKAFSLAAFANRLGAFLNTLEE
jgi:glycosyltransferase involved in cell wall biosynthesis